MQSESGCCVVAGSAAEKPASAWKQQKQQTQQQRCLECQKVKHLGEAIW
jgi:hypothetical protein